MTSAATHDLTEYDRKVLMEIAQSGSGGDLAWGAAMSVALGHLQGALYVTRGRAPKITNKGREALGLPPKPRQRFDDLPRAQQAGMLCNDAQFQAFAGARTIKDGATHNASGCAEYIRTQCQVSSRAHLNTNPAAAALFDALRTEFDAWRGRIGKPN